MKEETFIYVYNNLCYVLLQATGVFFILIALLIIYIWLKPHLEKPKF